MTWKRIAQLAVAVAVLGLLSFSAGADWFGGASLLSTGHTTSALHRR